MELQKVLGDRVEVTLKDMSPEERQTENEQTALIVEIAKQMVNNGDLILRTEKLAAQSKCLSESYALKLVSG